MRNSYNSSPGSGRAGQCVKIDTVRQVDAAMLGRKYPRRHLPGTTPGCGPCTVQSIFFISPNFLPLEVS